MWIRVSTEFCTVFLIKLQTSFCKKSMVVYGFVGLGFIVFATLTKRDLYFKEYFFVISSGWLASYSGSVGGACINYSLFLSNQHSGVR